MLITACASVAHDSRSPFMTGMAPAPPRYGPPQSAARNRDLRAIKASTKLGLG